MDNFRTYNLAVNFYRQSQTLSLSGALRSQFQRASLSIVLNLAEGSGRGSFKEQRRFYLIAMGSLRECQAVLHIEDLRGTELYKMLDTVGANLYRLINRKG